MAGVRSIVRMAAMAGGVALAAPALAQTAEPCGTELSEATGRRHDERERAGVLAAALEAYRPTDEPPRVRVIFHILRASDGSGGIDPALLPAELDAMNAAFAPAGFGFVQEGPIRFIDDDRFYPLSPLGSDMDELRLLYNEPGAMNVFYASNLILLCGLSSFSGDAVQGIIISEPCVNTPVTAHEVGHYFDLYHTHERSFGLECPDGSNCDVAGDLLCDTPADPGLSREVGPGCTYIGTDVRCGQMFEPDVRNVMSYSEFECMDRLTDGQYQRALSVLLAERADHIVGECPADLDGDGVLTIFDFLAFQNLFDSGDPAADFDGDGALTIFDFLAFQNAFDAGCA